MKKLLLLTCTLLMWQDQNKTASPNQYQERSIDAQFLEDTQRRIDNLVQEELDRKIAMSIQQGEIALTNEEIALMKKEIENEFKRTFEDKQLLKQLEDFKTLQKMEDDLVEEQQRLIDLLKKAKQQENEIFINKIIAEEILAIIQPMADFNLEPQEETMKNIRDMTEKIKNEMIDKTLKKIGITRHNPSVNNALKVQLEELLSL